MKKGIAAMENDDDDDHDHDLDDDHDHEHEESPGHGDRTAVARRSRWSLQKVQ